MKVVYDIETIVNAFTYCDLNPKTGDKHEFVIHEDRNDFLEFMKHLKLLTGQIGFNNIGFDSQVIQHIFKNEKQYGELTWVGDGGAIANDIFQFAQKVIQISNHGGFLTFPEWKLTIPQLDLFKIWHFDNKAKMTSLKWVEYMIDLPSIEEMPLDFRKPVTLTEIEEQILPYNRHDVYATNEFFKITKGETDLPLYKGVNKIELRQNIRKEFGIKCMNYNDVKIGDAINQLSYCKLAGIHKKDLPTPETELPTLYFKDCIPDYITFQTPKFKQFHEELSRVQVDFYDKQEFNIEYNGTEYTIAKGGIHSTESHRIVKPNENEYLRDADVGSQYPNALRKRKLYPKHLGVEWLEGYVGIIEKRLAAKKKYKQTKIKKYNAIQEAYKLSLNGGGLTNGSLFLNAN